MQTRLLAPICALIALAAVSACSSDSPAAAADAGKAVSFQTDVMPILSESCALASCHSAGQASAGIHLTYDPAQVYAELQKTSVAYSKKFVVAGNPDQSFIIAKMDGVQVAFCGSACGTEMPPPEEKTGDALLPVATRNIVKQWIREGAKNN